MHFFWSCIGTSVQLYSCLRKESLNIQRTEWAEKSSAEKSFALLLHCNLLYMFMAGDRRKRYLS